MVNNRPLEIRWIEDFLALAELGHFSRAAEARSVAQPVLSRHIKALEEWAGVPLVDRSAHPVALTTAGHQLLPQVQSALASLEAARIKALAAHDEANASLRFAITHALSLHFFPHWLAELESRLRLGPIQTLSDHSRACEDLMVQRRVQFMLAYAHPLAPGRLDEAGYASVLLGEDRLVPVCASNAQGGPLIELDAPSGPLHLLQYSAESGLGRILQSVQRRNGWAPGGLGARSGVAASVVFTAHNALLLKSMALAGRGVAWLPATTVTAELEDGRLRPAGGATHEIGLQIRLYRQGAMLMPLAEQIWSLVQTAHPVPSRQGAP